MQNEIIVNAELGETRVAVLERSQFNELYIERDKDKSVVGAVVKGRVTRVLPGMQAAFVDIGLEKAAFLYAGDYFANGFTEETGDAPDRPQRRGRRNSRQPPKIESLLKEDQEIVVQIGKQPIGSKGARIISHISIPGRHLVLTPWSRRVGVSRRIGSDRERRRLREIVERLRPKDLGFIIRTAGEGVREADLEADIRYLEATWKAIAKKNESSKAPCALHSEPDLPLRMIRDFVGPETKRIVVDSAESFAEMTSFVDRYVADPKPRIEHYQGQEPIFDAFNLESQIHANLGRKVFLKSGGSLVLDHGEALTMIDVNTGRYVGKRDLQETVFKTNLEAVKEVVVQLRFRNIGGLIIIDLIDMESADHRDKVYRALQEALRADKARTNILKISELGLVEMTRKRTRENLVQTLCEPCAYCEGRGYVLSSESVAFRVVREVKKDLPSFSGRRLALSVTPQVAEELLRNNSKVLVELGEATGREIEVRACPGMHQEQFEIEALDSGPPVEIPLSWLEDPKLREQKADKPDSNSADDGDGNGRSRSRRRRGGRGSRRNGSRGGNGADAEFGESDDSEGAQVDAQVDAKLEAGVEGEVEAEVEAQAEAPATQADSETGDTATETTADSQAVTEASAPSTSQPAADSPEGEGLGATAAETSEPPLASAPLESEPQTAEAPPEAENQEPDAAEIAASQQASADDSEPTDLQAAETVDSTGESRILPPSPEAPDEPTDSPADLRTGES